jgi:hypothetical protein
VSELNDSDKRQYNHQEIKVGINSDKYVNHKSNTVSYRVYNCNNDSFESLKASQERQHFRVKEGHLINKSKLDCDSSSSAIIHNMINIVGRGMNSENPIKLESSANNVTNHKHGSYTNHQSEQYGFINNPPSLIKSGNSTGKYSGQPLRKKQYRINYGQRIGGEIAEQVHPHANAEIRNSTNARLHTIADCSNSTKPSENLRVQQNVKLSKQPSMRNNYLNHPARLYKHL